MTYALLSESWPVARKQHRCIWCGEPIPIGEKYRREYSVFDGHFQNHAWHSECDDDARDYFSSGEDVFIPYSAERPVQPIPAAVPSHRAFLPSRGRC